MKILITSLFIASLLYSEQLPDLNIQTLSGKTKLSCEAILCLSTGNRPSECNPSINYYFNIHKKKWKDTKKARRNFLRICPVGDDAENDSDFTKLRDNILINLRSNCSLENLNKLVNRYENEHDMTSNLYKVNDKLLDSCKALMKSKYTYIKPVYTCNKTNNNWYPKKAWDKGIYYKKIPFWELDNFNDSEKYSFNDGDGISYYQKIELKKDCWKFEK